MLRRKLNVPSVSDMIRNKAVFRSPMVSRASSSYFVISLTSSISKRASRAPQEIRIDLAVFPETKSQEFFSIVSKKVLISCGLRI